MPEQPGHCTHAERNLEDAERILLGSLKTKEAALGKDHPDVAVSQINLAWLKLQQGHLDWRLIGYPNMPPFKKRPSEAARQRPLPRD